MKKYTEKTAAAMLKKLLRATAKDCREALRYTWIDENKRQCCCDGFRAYRLKTPVPGVPDMPRHLRGIDLDKVFPAAKDLQEIPLPALDDVKALYSADCANKEDPRRYHFAFGSGLPTVDLRYLYEMIQLFPDARLYVGKLYSPLLFISEHGDGVLLPMRARQSASWTAERNAAELELFQTPRQIPQKETTTSHFPVFSLAAFIARFAA